MTKLNLEGNQSDILKVLAIMLFPENEKLQKQYICATLELNGTVDATFYKPYAIDKNDSPKILLDSPTSKQFSEKIVPKATQKAIVVGSMLTALYLMDMHEFESPSKSKARHIAIFLTRKILNSDDKHLTLSERTVDKYWNEYKSVAHLWAAFVLNNEYTYHNDDNIFIPDAFPTFLEIAASLQDFGTSFSSDQLISNESILNLNSLWSLPEDMVRKKLNTDSNLLHIREALKTYKAPNRKKSKK